MTRFGILRKSTPAARGLREGVGGGVAGTPTVTFGATSLSEGGTSQGQGQSQRQAHGFVLDLARDLPLPPSMREGAAQQPGGSCTHPVAQYSSRDVSLLVLA
jgi:hypothetical protein